MTYRVALLAAAGVMALGTASAQDKDGYYISGGLGYAWEYGENDFESDGNAVPTEFDTNIDTDAGFATHGAIGKYFSNGLRGEIEMSYRLVDVDSLPGDGTASWNGFGSIDGNMSAVATMVNVLKDFQVTEKLTPYVGAGVGVAQVRFDFDNVDDIPAATSPADAGGNGYRIFMKNRDYVPAFQLRAGARYDLTEKLALDVGYRYLQTGQYDSEAFVNNPVADVTGDYRVHETTVGLVYNFGGGAAAATAAAAAPAATAAAVPQTKTCFDGTVVPMGQECPVVDEDALTPAELRTVVYFDLDSSRLTPAAEALLRRRADEASDVDLVEVVVSGNTDTTGSAGYNQRLSQRRAEVVKDALVGFGIDVSKIRIRALGETNLARATADGVNEPLNRRTEVEFDF
ncbi:MAG: OmpA family protein [Pseudomonadota bacterium]